MTITFLATLQGSTTMKMDSDNSGIIKLTFDGSQWSQVVKLSMYQEQALRVTIETMDGKHGT
jgi:hypothetical protein